MPKKGSDFEKRPALPADSRALDPKLVVAAAFVKLREEETYEHAIEDGDTEARDAALYVMYARLIEEAEAALEEIQRTTGLTKPSAERVIEDRRERQRLFEHHGDGWRGLKAKFAYDHSSRARKPEKRAVAE